MSWIWLYIFACFFPAEYVLTEIYDLRIEALFFYCWQSLYSKSTALRNNLHWEQGGKFLWTLATALILHFLLSQTAPSVSDSRRVRWKDK